VVVIANGGAIRARAIVISGQVVGNLIATQRLEMCGAARVFGDIEAPVVVMEEGVIFQGHCQMTPEAGAPALPPDARGIDARGRSILRGLVEAHFHPTYFNAAALEGLPEIEPGYDLAGGLLEALAPGRLRHGDVLVVTHGGVIQVGLGRTIGNRSRGLFPFVIDNCSISILTQGRARTVISGVNDVSHLHDGAVAAIARRDRSGGLTQPY